MSLTTMAVCSNHRSLLRDGTGIGRPSGGEMYWVSSSVCSPSFMCTTRTRLANTPLSVSYALPATCVSATFSKLSTFS